MSFRVYNGTVISDLVALVEKHICVVFGCDHLGELCAECSRVVCTVHSERCPDCKQIHCEECATFHPTFCDKATGQTARGGDDPIHDHRRNELREVQR